MWHGAWGWEGHVDARWRLRHRAVLNGGLGLCVCIQLGLIVVLWAVEMCLSFSMVGRFLYSLWSQFVWLRWWVDRFHRVRCA